jgi:hypothetical protein
MMSCCLNRDSKFNGDMHDRLASGISSSWPLHLRQNSPWDILRFALKLTPAKSIFGPEMSIKQSSLKNLCFGPAANHLGASLHNGLMALPLCDPAALPHGLSMERTIFGKFQRPWRTQQSISTSMIGGW